MKIGDGVIKQTASTKDSSSKGMPILSQQIKTTMTPVAMAVLRIVMAIELNRAVNGSILTAIYANTNKMHTAHAGNDKPVKDSPGFGYGLACLFPLACPPS